MIPGLGVEICINNFESILVLFLLDFIVMRDDALVTAFPRRKPQVMGSSVCSWPKEITTTKSNHTPRKPSTGSPIGRLSG